MATKIVGLDLGTHTVKVCELVTTFRKFELVGFGSEAVGAEADARADFEAIADAAHRLLDRRGLLSETVMCALPPDFVSTLALEFPFSQPKKISQVLPFQLDDAVPLDVEDLVYDYQIVEKREDDSALVLVSYVKEETLGGFIEALSARGIDPKVVGIGALSYFNLYDQLIGADATAPVALLELGHSHTEMVVFDGGMPRLVRDVAGGGRHITAALAQAFNVDAAQAERGKLTEGYISLASQDTLVEKDSAQARQAIISKACRDGLRSVIREARRTLVAHEVATGRPVERLFITGGTSQLRGLSTYLEGMLGVQVIQLDPLAGPYNRLAEGGDRLRPYISKSLALSLRAFNRKHQSQVNFRRGDYAYTGDFGFLRGRIISMGVMLTLIVVMAAMVAVTRKRVLEAEYRTLTNQTVALSEQILGYESEDVDLLLTTVQPGANKSVNLIPEVSAFEMLRDLSDRIGFDLVVDVDRFELDLDKGRLNIHGKTSSGGDVERLVDIIQAHRCLNKVKKDRVEKSLDERTKFRLSGAMNCG